MSGRRILALVAVALAAAAICAAVGAAVAPDATLAEGVGVTDSAASVAGASIAVAEGVGVADGPGATAGASTTVAEGVGVHDSPSGITGARQTVTEGVGVHDSSGQITGAIAHANEGVGVHDSPDSHIVNTSPRLTLADFTGKEGTAATAVGSFVDPDPSDQWTITVDYGDSSTPQPVQFDANHSFTLDHVYNDNGTYVVTVVIHDGAGGTDTRTATATIDNVAPTAALANSGPIDEGSSATVSFSQQQDPSSADTTAGFTYAFACDGAQLGAVGTSASTVCAFDDDGIHTVKARISDKDGGFTDYTTNVVVRGVAPTATVANNGPVPEGSPATISFSNQLDPSPADTSAGFRYSVACDGITFVPTLTPSATCMFDDGPTTHVVRAQISDKDGLATTYETTVAVTNAAPDGTLGNSGPVKEGSPVTVGWSGQSDPSQADTAAGFTYQFACDGQTLGVPTTTPTTTCKWDDGPSSHTVLSRITDKDGGSTDKTTSVQVDNADPTATPGNDGPVAEGAPVAVRLSNPADPSPADQASLRFVIDCSGGAITTGYPGASPSASATCTYDDGPSDRTVTMRVLDKDGGYTDYTTVVHVRDVAPTATLPAAAAVDEGSPLTVAFTNPTDPSTADTAAGFHYAYDCNNGSLVGSSYANAQASPNLTCTYPDGPATATVRARIFDKDGGFSEYTVAVTVRNVPPVVGFTGGDTTINEGSDPTVVHTYTYKATDAGHDALHFVSSDCGAGQKVAGSDTFDPATGNGSFKCTFPASFLADGTATSSTNVSATIGDKDGGNGTGPLAVRVVNVPPTVSISQPLNGITYAVNTTVTLTATFVDSTKLDQPHRCSVDWSDGTSMGTVTEVAGSTTGRCVATHVYRVGGGKKYTITASITDKDGGVGTKSVTITEIG